MTTLEKRLAAMKAKTDELAMERAAEIERAERARRNALAATLDVWLKDQPEDKLTALFVSLEKAATAKNRKLIQKHPARPSNVDAASQANM